LQTEIAFSDDNSSITNLKETPTAVHQVKEDENSEVKGSSAVVIGVSVVIFIIIVTIVIVSGVFFYR
jgi:hypothetical protein